MAMGESYPPFRVLTHPSHQSSGPYGGTTHAHFVFLLTAFKPHAPLTLQYTSWGLPRALPIANWTSRSRGSAYIDFPQVHNSPLPRSQVPRPKPTQDMLAGVTNLFSKSHTLCMAPCKSGPPDNGAAVACSTHDQVRDGHSHDHDQRTDSNDRPPTTTMTDHDHNRPQPQPQP